ncbi:MAG TPA: ANTAR domain-containing protein [Candidatus Acidoferrales bacterium]|nr:ANTAR domain-containing protein [Candidatus Acidoferrales bacterium]
MKRKALLIDDHLPSRNSLARALREQGCEVIGEAADEESAVGLARALSPDVVFVAFGLSGADGVTVARHLMEARPLPIVMLTSHFEKDTIERAKAAGVMAYLVKPLRKEELLPAIELAISRYAELRSLRTDNETLKKMLASRKLIERAKGILMKSQGLSEADAFALLQKKSMTSHLPMVEIARAIILAEDVKRG